MKRSNQYFWKLCALALAFLLSAGLSETTAQNRSITGIVTSEEGEALIGATVIVKEGAGRGTVTAVDGTFTLEAASGEALLISYTGYETQEVQVTEASTYEIQLGTNVSLLDEVVVVGYGTSKKSDLTGAVSSVSGEDLRNSITTNVDQALQGRVAGVQVTQNSGQPGGAASIRIRGSNSITGSSEPLYVIDGIPFQGDGASVAGFDWAGGANGQNRVNPLSTINPNDIVRIEVLKDASATAIYGARAANGVVLITTRRGESGTTKISYNAYYAQQRLPKKLEMMDLPAYASYQVQIANDLDRQVNQRYLDPSLLGPGTDWQDEIFQNAGMQSHQLSVSGGNDRTQYAISGGYFQQDGIVIGSNFNRLTTRLNLDNTISDRFKVGASLAFADTDEKITLNDGGDGVIMQALVMPPDVAVRDLDGEFAGPTDNTSDISFNPVGAALLRNNTLDRQRLMANIYGDLEVIRNLTFRSE
ncbi:MAG: SusC/RagA family TonB-linked outer membrane protein, partial [Phaeodactylibacter sp.]|nr:SusC/RagA family TonB-linked outer membrane protein [Phaeodactylibacter sp.]